ncbi:MAG: DUF4476 domain-containing protein [Porphyromonas sp.]|nr:DUF4476 domain-containing protein [Porphyromonas sp.]
MIIRHLLLVSALVLLMGCGLTNTPQGPSMRERAMRIQMGLTEHQVLDIMGEEPYTRTFEYNRSVWSYRQHYSGYLWQIDFVDGRVVALRNNISERLEKKHDLEDLARLQQSQHKPIVVEINPQHAAPSPQPTQAPQHGGYIQGTSPESFDKLVQRIKRAFHHEQMGLVEQAAAIYSFTPQQVAQLMQIFDFRNERNQALRKLIPALAYLHDLEPIYKLYDFESERRELDQLIRAEGERRRGLRRP